MKHEADRLLEDHSYDGIQEFDNPTPGWWHALFALTCLIAVPYYVIFELNPDVPTVHQSHERMVVRETMRQFAEIGQLTADEATILRFSTEPKWLGMASSLFRGKCASCHGPEAEGGSVGPNMTDDFYKNVKTVTDFARVITDGAAAGAMPSWKTQLSTNEIVLLSSLLVSKRGQNLPSPRPAEGERIAPFPTMPGASPSTGAGGASSGSGVVGTN